jgi:hypothetical protein
MDQTKGGPFLGATGLRELSLATNAISVTLSIRFLFCLYCSGMGGLRCLPHLRYFSRWFYFVFQGLLSTLGGGKGLTEGCSTKMLDRANVSPVLFQAQKKDGWPRGYKERFFSFIATRGEWF